MIYLPAARGRRGRDAARGHRAPDTVLVAGGRETILLVEDEAPIRTLISRHLRALGYTVLEADDGVSALRGLPPNMPALINILVTDVVMPRMNGTELHRQLRAQIPG